MRRCEILSSFGESFITHPGLAGEMVEMLSDLSLIKTKEDGNRAVMKPEEIHSLDGIDKWEVISTT